MSEIAKDVETILNKYKQTYVDKKTPQEYGRSAFWRWYDQIKRYIFNIENSNVSFGFNLQFEMKYWGIIHYTKTMLPNGTIVSIIIDLKLDNYNLTNWLNHAPLNDTLFIPKLNRPEHSVNVNRPVNHKFPEGRNRTISNYRKCSIIQNSETQLYGLAIRNELLTKCVFMSIQWNRDMSNQQLLAFGVTQDGTKYSIDINGRCQSLNESKRHFAVLTESRLNFIIKDAIRKILLSA